MEKRLDLLKIKEEGQAVKPINKQNWGYEEKKSIAQTTPFKSVKKKLDILQLLNNLNYQKRQLSNLKNRCV